MTKKKKKPIFLRAFLKEMSTYKNISLKYGHWLSITKRSAISDEKDSLPWYTYPAIEYLDQFDYSEKMIFEWGCGSSSLFWGKRAKEVISIEDDSEWFEKMLQKRLPNNKIFFLQTKEEYINALGKQKKLFDIIVIDGKYRKECAKLSPRFLCNGGLIIFDNSDRYPDLLKEMRVNNNYSQVDFHGFGPINSYSWTTSILFSGSELNLERKNDILLSKAGLN
jgi:hypothetical protein